MKKLGYLSFILIFLIFPLTSLCKETPNYGGTLVIGVSADASILVPMIATDAMSHDVCDLIFSNILKLNPQLKLVGDLAKGYKVSKDEKTITFYLRRGVKWQDGKPFTARDVFFAYKLITNPKVPSPYSSEFKEVKKFEILGNYTFRVTYKRPFAPALLSWSNLVVLPAHILKGKGLNYLLEVFGRHPVGNGPFVLEKWIPQTEIVLKYNPLYYKGRPYLDYIIYKIIPDPATRFMELKTGGVDWISLTPLQYLQLKRDKSLLKKFRVYKYPSFSFTYIGYNLRFWLFKDKRVRQALCYAINKKEVIKGALLGQGIPAYGPYTPGTWYYDKKIENTCHYDPKKAEELLKEAGFKKGKDGILEKDGKKFEFTLLVNQGNLARMLAAQIIQQELAKVGIKMHIRVVEWTTLINQFIMKRHFQAVILGWVLGPDPDIYEIFHSSQVNPPGFNFVGYKNPELDKLLEEGRYTLSLEKRKKIYYKVQEILAEDQPYTFLYIPYSLEAISKRIKGVKPSKIGIGYNIEKWWIPKRLQKRRLK
ncbi:MAG: peptide-binding protein [Thermodesulfobacteria bacterium]|nr:peptide-binding protein [Thermodesulfobacteriota bacterium]